MAFLLVLVVAPVFGEPLAIKRDNNPFTLMPTATALPGVVIAEQFVTHSTLPAMLTDVPEAASSAGWHVDSVWRALVSPDFEKQDNGTSLLQTQNTDARGNIGAFGMSAIVFAMLLLQYLIGHRFCPEYEFLKEHCWIAARDAREARAQWLLSAYRQAIESEGDLATCQERVDALQDALSAREQGSASDFRTGEDLREHLALTERSSVRTLNSQLLERALAAWNQALWMRFRNNAELRESLVLARSDLNVARIEWLESSWRTANYDPEVARTTHSLEMLRVAMDYHLHTHGCHPQKTQPVRPMARPMTA